MTTAERGKKGKEAARLQEIAFLRRMIQPRRFFPHDEPKHDRHPEQTKRSGAKVCAAKDPNGFKGTKVPVKTKKINAWQ